MKMDAPRPRGRPRAFDEAKVLDAVLSVFWTKGYSAASLDDLSAAAGVTRPSLYAAFGDKEAMYLRALSDFQGRVEVGFAAAFAQGDVLEGLDRFYQAALEQYLEQARGCMVMCTAPVEATSSLAIRSALSAMVQQIDDHFTAVMARAMGGRDLGRAQALGKLASAVLHSLAIRARAGATELDLRAFARQSAYDLMALAKSGH